MCINFAIANVGCRSDHRVANHFFNAMILCLGILSSVAVPAVAVWRLAQDRRVTSVAVLCLALCYFALNVTAVLRLSGILPATGEGFAGNIAANHAYAPSLILLLVNVGLAYCVWRRVRWHHFVAIVVGGFLLAGCLGSLFTHNSVGGSLFGLCVTFLAAVAFALGLTYKEFCVIGNNYIQAFLVVASALWLFVEAARAARRRATPVAWGELVLSGLISAGYVAAFYHVCVVYWPPLEPAFDRCVRDLCDLATLWHSTYIDVNILIYIVAFVAAIVCNAACVWLLRRRWGRRICVVLTAVHLLAMTAVAYSWPLPWMGTLLP